ncbi:MAG: hypothetical protein WD066_16670 [Planctomycetaceae bacterium]
MTYSVPGSAWSNTASKCGRNSGNKGIHRDCPASGFSATSFRLRAEVKNCLARPAIRRAVFSPNFRVPTRCNHQASASPSWSSRNGRVSPK